MRVDNERKRAYPAMREPPRGTRRRGNEKATAQTCPNASKVSRLNEALFFVCDGQIKSYWYTYIQRILRIDIFPVEIVGIDDDWGIRARAVGRRRVDVIEIVFDVDIFRHLF